MTQAPARPAVPADPAAADPGADDVRRDAGRLPWVVALVVYSTLVALVVGWPSPVDAGARGSLSSTLAALHARGVPLWVDYALVERAANVAMFVPLGFMVTRLHRRWWFGLLVPAALSCSAELGQHLLRPERYATWADVAANTGGAALGMIAAMLLGRRAVTDPGTPGSTAARRRPARSPRRSRSPRS